jgi:hypothetical protein
METGTPAAAVRGNGVVRLDRGRYSAEAFCSIVVSLMTGDGTRADRDICGEP